jgi:hypothetical protein
MGSCVLRVRQMSARALVMQLCCQLWSCCVLGIVIIIIIMVVKLTILFLHVTTFKVASYDREADVNSRSDLIYCCR